MVECAFLVVPEGGVPAIEGWEQMDRGARLDALERARAGLDRQVRERLRGCEVEYMAGAGSWTVRAADDAAGLRLKLAGLPVRVADDEQYVAL